MLELSRKSGVEWLKNTATTMLSAMSLDSFVQDRICFFCASTHNKIFITHFQNIWQSFQMHGSDAPEVNCISCCLLMVNKTRKTTPKKQILTADWRKPDGWHHSNCRQQLRLASAGDASESAKAFIKAIARHRHPERETDPPKV